MNLDAIIRPEIRAMGAYAVPDASGMIKLDAMENPYHLPDAMQAELALHLQSINLNRYPAPQYAGLKHLIHRHLSIPEEFPLVLGNGSDELISMLSLAVARPGAKIMAPMPAFVMYPMAAKLAGVDFVSVPLQADFTLDLPALLAAIAAEKPALLYLAYPNNPTGTLYPRAEVQQVLAAMAGHGLVVIDEAYQPFAGDSLVNMLAAYPHLIVMRTVSKLGLAGARLGYMAGHAEVMSELEKIRPPYNINVLTEAAVSFILPRAEVLQQQAAAICQQRAHLQTALQKLAGVEVFPSAANFLLIRVAASDEIHTKLLEQKILVKNVGKMHKLLHNCLRITVSNEQENAAFLAAFEIALKAVQSNAIAVA